MSLKPPTCGHWEARPSPPEQQPVPTPPGPVWGSALLHWGPGHCVPLSPLLLLLVQLGKFRDPGDRALHGKNACPWQQEGRELAGPSPHSLVFQSPQDVLSCLFFNAILLA